MEKKSSEAYRPKYRQLGELRSLVNRKIPVVALTATADQETRKLIINTLCMDNPIEILVTPEKINVKYSVEMGGKEVCSNFKWLEDLLIKYGEKCPRIIVFFRQIKHIVEVFEFLQTTLGQKQFTNTDNTRGNGYWNRIFAMFHQKTNDTIKNEVCTSFQDENGIIRVCLCSTSFSMGLDVKNVDYVVHYGPANDVDDYLQESGRAGRNPNAKCNAVLIKHKYSLNSKNISSDMKKLVLTKSCRRVELLSRFACDTLPLNPKHDCCDNCAMTCTCLCSCKSECKCDQVCNKMESEVLQMIRETLKLDQDSSSSSSSEGFSSDSDIENYLLRKPTIVYTSSDSE